MKKFIGSIKKRGSSHEASKYNNPPPPQGDGPEATVHREVTAFCEAGAPGSNNAGDEYLHLPAIVDAAESTANAAREASLCIRRYLSKENYTRGYAQYNAIMLLRILSDNPGRAFTKFFDEKFVSTVKTLLKEGRDASVQQILRETLDHLEAENARDNDSLMPLVQMWQKEKGKNAGLYSRAYQPGRNGPQPPTRPPKGLPPPDELAARIEEAKTTARLLVQTVQSTPSNELMGNELVKEFAERAQAAHKSIQQFMNSENPAPDEDVMLTLIETNDQLNIAMSRHQRAVLQSRKAMGQPSPQPSNGNQNSYMGQQQPATNTYTTPTVSPEHGPYSSSPPRQTMNNPNMSPQDQYIPPAGPPPGARGAIRQSQNNTYGAEELPGSPPANRPTSQTYTASQNYGVSDNPFADENRYAEAQRSGYSLFDRNKTTPSPQPQSYTSPSNLYQQQNNDYSYNSSPRPTSYQPTQSYLYRQDSAANNLTMHGASPPPQRTDSNQGHNAGAVRPIDDDRNGLNNRMQNMRIV